MEPSAAAKRCKELQATKDKLAGSTKDKFWANYEEVVIVSGDNEECKLKCVFCQKLFTASNPSQSAKTHFSDNGCDAFKASFKASLLSMSERW